MLYKVVLTLNLEDKNLAKVDNSMKTIKQRFHLVLFLTLYKVHVLNFEPVESKLDRTQATIDFEMFWSN